MTRRVVIAGGGTGGHIFPGLAVVRELPALGAEPHWLGARRGLEAESLWIDARQRRLESRVDLHLALGGGFDAWSTEKETQQP